MLAQKAGRVGVERVDVITKNFLQVKCHNKVYGSKKCDSENHRQTLICKVNYCLPMFLRLLQKVSTFITKHCLFTVIYRLHVIQSINSNRASTV